MPKRSAGLLMYRKSHDVLEVFLVHPGGPFWARKDLGAWTIPKGEYEPNEDPLAAARREFQEETSFAPNGPYIALDTIRQTSGKLVTAWAFAGDCEPSQLVSNTCMIEWPPHSKRQIEIPEVDQGRWFNLAQAAEYIRKEQAPLLEAIQKQLSKAT